MRTDQLVRHPGRISSTSGSLHRRRAGHMRPPAAVATSGRAGRGPASPSHPREPGPEVRLATTTGHPATTDEFLGLRPGGPAGGRPAGWTGRSARLTSAPRMVRWWWGTGQIRVATRGPGPCRARWGLHGRIESPRTRCPLPEAVPRRPVRRVRWWPRRSLGEIGGGGDPRRRRAQLSPGVGAPIVARRRCRDGNRAGCCPRIRRGGGAGTPGGTGGGPPWPDEP